MTEPLFFIASMPVSRSADYCLGYRDGSVFFDFNNDKKDRIQLKRISFDGYGCCELNNKIIALDAKDSRTFKLLCQNDLYDQKTLLTIVKKAIELNKKQIWPDALEKYDLY